MNTIKTVEKVDFSFSIHLCASMTGSIFASLSGDSASLTSHFLPELQLDNSCSYSCALIECHYAIGWNIVEGENNSIYYAHRISTWTDQVNFSVRIPSGYYTFNQLSAYIENASSEHGHTLRLKLDKTTMKTTIMTGDVKICIEVRPEHTDGLAPSLGFENGFYCKMEEYSSANAANLWNFTTIRLDCDLISGSYHNGNITHAIYELDLSEIDYDSIDKVGYKIVMRPTHPIYLPINRHRINSINITAFDLTGERLKFKHNERLHCRIHIKKDADLSEHP